MKKALFTAALALLVNGMAFAGVFSHTTDQNTVYFSANVSVPSAASCYQFGAAYVDGVGSYIYNAGPLGAYTRYPGDPLNISGAISAGNYSITQYVSYSGYSGTTIAW